MTFDRDQLVKICALFNSTNAGERASAALKAARLVEAAGLSWSEVVMPASYEERLSLALELQERGWPPRAAAGIAMCLNVPVNGAQLNLANWHGGRWSQFLDFCSRNNNADINWPASQLNYLSGNLKSVYSGLAAKIIAAKTVDEAAGHFRKYMGDAEGILT